MLSGIKKLIKRILGKDGLTLLFQIMEIPRGLTQELKYMSFMPWRFFRNRSEPEFLLSKFRIWAHILDKGIQACCWEPGRGLSAYKQCLELEEQLRDSEISDDPSYVWAVNRLREYEEKQNGCDVAITNNVASVRVEGLTSETLAKAIKSRRSVRQFENRPIEPEVLNQLVDIINWAPNSCNRQPIKLFITQDPELIPLCMEQCAGATCFDSNIPCFVSVCADMRSYAPLDRNLSYIDASLGVQNMLLLGHSYGVEGTVLNWTRHTRKQRRILSEKLEIPSYCRIVFNIAMGYANQYGPPPARKGIALTAECVGKAQSDIRACSE